MMNKSHNTLIIFVLGLLAFVNIASAEENPPGKRAGEQLQAEYATPGLIAETVIQPGRKTLKEIQTIREQNMVKMEELKKKTETLRDKTKMQAQKQRIMGREIALERFDNAIDKLENNKKLIENNLLKLETLGIDTTSIETALTEVQMKIDQAKEKIAEIHNILSSTAEILSKDNKEKLNSLTRETQILVKDTHNILINAVKNLRELIAQRKVKILNTAQ